MNPLGVGSNSLTFVPSKKESKSSTHYHILTVEVVHWKYMLKLLAWCETLYTQELHVCAPLRSTVFWAQPIKFELSRNTRPPKYTQLSRNMEGVKRLSLEFFGTGYEHEEIMLPVLLPAFHLAKLHFGSQKLSRPEQHAVHCCCRRSRKHWTKHSL